MCDISAISSFCDKTGIAYALSAPLSGHCTFKTGGCAAVVTEPSSAGEAARLMRFFRASGTAYTALGRGSNVLFPDEGLNCAVILLGERFAAVAAEGAVITCQAGMSLTKLSIFACEQALSGLEFAYGIPGSVGGAVYMNAGAYGGEIKDILESAEHICADGTAGRLSGERLGMSYRQSAYTGTGMIITAAVFRLKKGNRDEIRGKMDDFMARRRAKQPLEFPSGGSTFKRPSGAYASELIDRCGLKGLSIGGAQVSEKHAGFVVNKGGATSADILALMRKIRDTVKEKTGFTLEPEIKIYRPDGTILTNS